MHCGPIRASGAAEARIGPPCIESDRKSTRLNSSHSQISYAGFCFKKKARLVGIDLDVTERIAAEQREDILQQQLRDASRQAGMADVATSVLHNVGNVLNSVNVSANLVTESLKRSRAAGLGRVVSLLQEHQSDLGRFVAHDERGKVLPVYLAELSRHLSADNRNALQELDSLKSNIDHIKDIVAMQQRYAKLGGVAEIIDIRHLVEESMRINASAFERHAVQVVREFADVPQITVDKHKVLQILVNLLRNAKDACQSMSEQERRVTVRIAQQIDQYLQHLVLV